MIVSLLDIHASSHTSTEPPSTPPLEILEAGTGHGALTLYLSRAISGGNPPLPASLLAELRENEKNSSLPSPDLEPRIGPSQELQDYLSSRRAILHTLDIVPEHSRHARKVVRDFRRGLYAGNVDFHIGDVKDWLADQTAKRSDDERRFLSHTILDLPNAEAVLQAAAEAMRDDGTLLVFNPSISQIQKCVETVRELRLPLLMDKVLELGAGWTGGREWDVRSVRTKKDAKASVQQSDTESEAVEQVANEEAMEVKEEGNGWVMVSRPKAYARVVGGGFLGVWRRMKPSNEVDQS